ncbi:MAG: hypothetical protein J2P45_18165 [Candidatus Dormibacteraeota bacterium]|nr:hypothetical protein [Candidatus Dormibacteraeota bacterium]
MARQLLGAVFKDEVEAGQAVRALHYWNRKRHQRLGIMTVVVCKSRGRAKYRPYRVMRARRGARWGMFLLAVVAGLLAVGAAAASSNFLGTVTSWTKMVTGDATGLVGFRHELDPGNLLAQASNFYGGRVVVAGVGAVILAGIAGYIVGGILGWLAHLLKGFRRSIRREVVAELAPGMAAVLTWARDSSIIGARSELERLGGSPPPTNSSAPQAQSQPSTTRTGAWVPPPPTARS